MASPKKFLTSETVRIILAIIGLLGTLGVAYFQYVWKPSQPPDTVPTQYSGWILDARSQQPIVNAKVTLKLPGSGSVIDYTDTEGYYLFNLKLTRDQRSGRIHVDADGYTSYDRNISLPGNPLEDIRLSKLPTATPFILPSQTPTLLPSATVTILPATETFTPLPPSHSPDLSIEKFAFCQEQEIDAAEVCTVSRTSFPQGITKIYMSWVYKGSFSGTYSRVWYTNGSLSALPTNRAKTWGADGTVDTTHLTNNNGFLPAEYAVEFRLDSNNQLIFKATFIVQ